MIMSDALQEMTAGSPVQSSNWFYSLTANALLSDR